MNKHNDNKYDINNLSHTFEDDIYYKLHLVKHLKETPRIAKEHLFYNQTRIQCYFLQNWFENPNFISFKF